MAVTGDTGQRGLSLVEALVAVALLGLTAIFVLPAFLTQVDANTRNEVRTAAVGMAQERLESLRLVDPETLPTGGAPDSTVISLGGRDYEVRTHYCQQAAYCPPTSPGARHLHVEVLLDGQRIYDAETVFTQLR